MDSLEQTFTDPVKLESLLDRYWPKVDVRSYAECWPWKAKAKHPFGYGRMTAGRGVYLKAHRIAYRIQSGRPIPGRFHVLHDCDNPSCCNPWHLHLGFPKHNSREAVERGRASKPPIRRGDKHHMVTIPDADLPAIRASRLPARVLAEKYSVSEMTIYRIRRGKTRT